MARWRIYVLTAVAMLSAGVWYVVLAEAPQAGTRAYVFDVGQGDAVFIEAENGNQVLIDGGPGDAVLTRLGEVMPFYDRYIDVVVVSHPHADHLAGLVEVVKRYRIGMVLEAGVAYESGEYEEWKRLLKEKNIRVILAHAGERVKLSHDTSLDILSPFADMSQEKPANIHKAMVTARLMSGSSTMLLMGDAETRLEQQLVFTGTDVRAEVLKVGHHGSKTSTSEKFLAAVSPRTAVVSVGSSNRYGHPHPDVMERLSNSEQEMYRTDRDGTVVVTMDTHGTRVFTSK